MTVRFAWGCYYQTAEHETTRLMDTELVVAAELGPNVELLQTYNDDLTRIRSVQFDHSIEPDFIPDGIICVVDNKSLVPDGYWFADKFNIVWKMVRIGFNEWVLISQANEIVTNYIKQMIAESL